MPVSRDFSLARLLAIFVLSLLFFVSRSGALPPDLEYFPSRLHAAVFRNWDIVTHERLAKVLGTDKQTIEKVGKEMGLLATRPLSAEEIRRNVEIVLRRNWAIFPRHQIEQLLGFTPEQFDEYLGKEIFLRALLASPPAGLSELKYAKPTTENRVRARWFSEQVRKHFNDVRSTREEPRLSFVHDLSRPHNSADYVSGTRPSGEETDLRHGWSIIVPNDAGEVLDHAVKDFASYCRDVQRCSGLKAVACPKYSKVIRVNVRPIHHDSAEAFVLGIAKDNISVTAASEVGLARGLVELERRMGERGGPFLKPVLRETNAPSFSPRYVYSYFSLLTDVLGQDVVEGHPDGYLDELFHQDADGVWVYTLLEDLVPSPVFPEIKKAGSEMRLQRLRNLVERAAKRGLKVYIYLNEPRAQPLAFFQHHAEVQGQGEGNTAALCTSTEAVQRHLRESFEKVFREVPGLGGVFVITASENLSNCYSHTRHPACPRCSKRNPEDVISETIRCMSAGVWAANPKAKFIVWDWSWHSVLGEETPAKIIAKLPKGVELMADFERGTQIVRGGIPMNVEEYSISVVGPSPRAKLRSEQAKHAGMDYLAKIQLSSTWECGTVPFIPVPNLLWRKAEALQAVGASGTMSTWTIGSYPSPNTEAFALRNWNQSMNETEGLRRIAARRYGEAAVEDAVRGWTKLSTAFTEEFPFSASPYAGPLQHGPCLPWYVTDIPAGYGNTTLFNCKDDWRHWTAPYPQDVMMKLLRHLCARWDEGIEDLRKAAAKAPPERRRMAERDLGVAWMVGYYYRTYANALEFYGARDGGDAVSMKRHASNDLKETTEAFRLVRSDSRFGWEVELQYFYRTQDVLEKLISLDAIVTPMK